MILLAHSPPDALLTTLVLVALILMGLAPALRKVRRFHRRRFVRPEPLCGRCHYVIAAGTSTCCSECGAELWQVGIVRRVDGGRRTHWPWYPVILLVSLPISVVGGGLSRYVFIGAAIPVAITLAPLVLGSLLCLLLLVRGLKPTYMLLPPAVTQTLDLKFRGPGSD
jgi:hypothetical protein